MAKALFLAWSSPTSDETQGEYDDWYDNTHIPQVRQAVPSIEKTTRYRVVDPAGSSAARFLTVYELEDGDVEKANTLLMGAATSGRLDMSDSMDRAVLPPKLEWYVEHS